MSRRYWACLSAVALLASPAWAVDHFDLIYPDHMVYGGFLADGLDKIVSGSIGFAIIVNTGQTNVTSDDLANASIITNAPRGSFSLELKLAGLADYGPILPGEAVGWPVCRNNAALLGLIKADEAFRNAGGWRFYAVVARTPGASDYATVPYDVRFCLGGGRRSASKRWSTTKVDSSRSITRRHPESAVLRRASLP
jgi:hypothetical protein